MFLGGGIVEQYIITGATGYLGNTIVRQLLDQNEANITILVLPHEDLSMFQGFPLKIVEGNVCDKEFLKTVIKEGSIVFHIAGIVDTTSSNKNALYQVNVGGTKNIADVCFEKKVKRLIYTSSVHTIIPLKNNEVLKEPIIHEPEKIVGNYAKTKALATKYIFEKVKEGLPAIVLYPAGIIGPNDYKVGNITQLMLDLINQDIKAQVKGVYNFIDVRDAAKAVINASSMGKIGEGYILSGNQIKVSEFFELVNKKMNRTKRTPNLAMWFVKLFAGFAGLYYKLRKTKPLFNRYSLYTLTSNCNFSNEKAKKDLQLIIRPVEISLFDEIDWLYTHKSDLIKKIKK